MRAFRAGVLRAPLADSPALGVLSSGSVDVFVALIVHRTNRHRRMIFESWVGGLGVGYLLVWLIGNVFNPWDVPFPESGWTLGPLAPVAAESSRKTEPHED